MTKAHEFNAATPSIGGIPEGVVSMAVVIVFDDGSIYCNFPVGTDREGEQTLQYALNLHGVITGDSEPAVLDGVGRPDFQIEA